MTTAKVTCTVCGRAFEVEGAAARRVARTVKDGDQALSLDCPFCKTISIVLVEGAEPAGPSLRCPVPGCACFVSFVEKRGRKAAFWGCGECASIWRDAKNLQREITAIVKRFPYRKSSYKKVGGAWVPGRDPASLTAKIEREPREDPQEFERD